MPRNEVLNQSQVIRRYILVRRFGGIARTGVSMTPEGAGSPLMAGLSVLEKVPPSSQDPVFRRRTANPLFMGPNESYILYLFADNGTTRPHTWIQIFTE